MKAVSALKKIRLLLIPLGDRSKKAVKGKVAKNNNRPPDNKKEHDKNLEGEPRLPFVLSGVRSSPYTSCESEFIREKPAHPASSAADTPLRE